METCELDSNDFCFYIYPFLELEDVTINVPSTNKSDSFGLQLSTDERYNRVYWKDTVPKSCLANSISKGKMRRLRGSFITHVNGD